eukprot:CAMPEP_0169211966 /NCGR_PEP_ID=MMETSP1016-20121227/16033_1 /TAXON_ID=342587 /ORGANISM="Karlodinium micrum, Strain CCMP2283" /LENGTH=86 /DNA_ID=CAMNT_0009289615 /DNA_START=421 /DNA_END=681 /DNA_ORIENTATION=-
MRAVSCEGQSAKTLRILLHRRYVSTSKAKGVDCVFASPPSEARGITLTWPRGECNNNDPEDLLCAIIGLGVSVASGAVIVVKLLAG